MPSTISNARLRKAFNEGRRSATMERARNPYENPKLQELWERGRAKQKAGELKTPIPPLQRGKMRARRVQQSPQGPGPRGFSRPVPPRPRRSPGNFGGPRPRGI
jgi:hypothetical protein